MNIAMWVLAGGILGWMGYTVLKFNEERGLIVSIIIGVVGGFFGGNVLAPMLGTVTDAPNNFNVFAMAVALASAAGCLAIGNLVSNRYGV
ncbi:MAG: hypothetical protein HYY78_00260 [Betaproteobacteria bacterium]|nr:hypothetical protein [Betaproteobacteria bacterium]